MSQKFHFEQPEFILSLHKISDSEAFRIVFIASHGVFLGEYKFYGEHKSLLVKSKKTEYGASNAAIDAAKRFWAEILCHVRVFNSQYRIWVQRKSKKIIQYREKQK